MKATLTTKTLKYLNCSALSLGLSFSAMAQTTQTDAQTSTIESESFYNKLVLSPVDFMVEVDTYTQRNTNVQQDNAEYNKIFGFQQDVYPYFSYKFTTKDSVRINPLFTVFDNELTNSAFIYNGTTLRYMRSQVLTQAEQGVDLSLEARLNHFGYRNVMNMADTQAVFTSDKNATHANGSLSLRANLSRSLTQNFSVASTLRFDKYDTNSASEGLLSARKEKLGLYLTPIYQITDKLAASNMFYYSVNFDDNPDTNDNKNNGTLEMVPALTYSFTNSLSLMGYWDSFPVVGSATKTLAPNWAEGAQWGLLLTYVAF